MGVQGGRILSTRVSLVSPHHSALKVADGRSAAEHLFTDSRVIIRENEPTSIIAFTLSSKPYREKMKNNKFASGRKVESFMPDESAAVDRASTWDIVSLDEAVETDDPSKREGGTHLKYGE